LRKAKKNLPAQETKADTPYGHILEKQALLDILKEKIERKEAVKRTNDRLMKLMLQARVKS